MEGRKELKQISQRVNKISLNQKYSPIVIYSTMTMNNKDQSKSLTYSNISTDSMLVDE